MLKDIKNQEAFDKLYFLHQEHLLKEWDHLNDEEKESLTEQILLIDPHLLFLQQEVLKASEKKHLQFEPFSNIVESGNALHSEKGHELLKQGKVGCIIVAGGQATRLGLKGSSKGCVPVSPIKHKTLFQLFAERTHFASEQAGHLLPLAIMTAPYNHEEITSYFKAHDFFGLQESQLFFFTQHMLPLLDKDANLYLETPAKIACGPDGNGLALHYFKTSSLFKQWKQMGIEMINFLQIDNALADPFDSNLIGFHHITKNDITIKCTRRRDENEKVGLLVKEEGLCRIIEYLEFPKNQWTTKDEKGEFLYFAANLSLFCFSMDFIESLHNLDVEMPLHAVKKEGYKFERFIFDLLAFTEKVTALIYPREDCFAPLKNMTGTDSIEEVKAAMQAKDAKTFKSISHTEVPTRPFELSQEFYYPSDGFLKKWHGKELPKKDYIE